MIKSSVLAANAVVLGMVAFVAKTQAEECSATLLSATVAQAKAPYAATMVTTLPGAPATQSEIVTSADKMYVRTNGKWASVPYSAQDMINLVTTLANKSKTSCKTIGPETMQGEAATVYQEQVVSDRNKVVDSKVWISDKRGMPLRVESNLGEGGTTVQSFRYDGVQPPAGVK